MRNRKNTANSFIPMKWNAELPGERGGGQWRAQGGLRTGQDDVVGAVTFAAVGGWGASLPDTGTG